MLKVKTELWIEWDFEKNDEMGLDIYKETYGSNKQAYWICRKCKSSFESSIKNRKKSKSCPYCSGQRINHTNSLASLRPDLALEWHPTKNGELTPYNVACNKGDKVWWIGGECKHEWDATVANRHSRGSGCPYCTNNKTLKGFNDMWTTDSKLASMLANPEDGYRYSYGSRVKLDWKCSLCNTAIKNKSANELYRREPLCIDCSDGKSYPEKIMNGLLSCLGIEFIGQKSFKWSDKKRYDFYLPDYNLIIETHGSQHYIGSFEGIGGNSLEEEQENDMLKYRLAQENGIDKYIVIDCRYSELEWIKNNILNSKMVEIFNLNNIDWNELNSTATKSLVFEVCRRYSEGNISTKKLMSEFQLSRQTISKYLHRGNEIGIIKYQDISKRSVIQLTMNGVYVNEFTTIKEASEYSGAHRVTIGACLAGKVGSAGGYRWVAKEEYNRYINESIPIKPFRKNNRDKPIIQLSLEGEYIREWISISEASRAVKLKFPSAIGECLSGRTKTAKGFKWMHKEDYIKILQSINI